MYCPKCGMENPDGKSICRSCGFVLISAGPAAKSSTGRTSGLAIASLVLGLLSFCTFLLTAPLAIIFGIISLVMISRSHGQLKGKGMAIAGIVVPIVMLPLIGILMGILMPALIKVKIQAERTVCTNNMTALGKAMHIYASDHNNMFPTPSNWCDLLIEHTEVSKNEFMCIAMYVSPEEYKGTCNYAMNQNIEKPDTNAPPDTVLLFESKPGWNQAGGPELLVTDNHIKIEKGCNILFVDGHVEFIRTEDIDRLRWAAEQ